MLSMFEKVSKYLIITALLIGVLAIIVGYIENKEIDILFSFQVIAVCLLYYSGHLLKKI